MDDKNLILEDALIGELYAAGAKALSWENETTDINYFLKQIQEILTGAVLAVLVTSQLHVYKLWHVKDQETLSTVIAGHNQHLKGAKIVWFWAVCDWMLEVIAGGYMPVIPKKGDIVRAVLKEGDLHAIVVGTASDIDIAANTMTVMFSGTQHLCQIKACTVLRRVEQPKEKHSGSAV